MSTGLWVLIALVISFAVTFWVIRVKLLGKNLFPQLTQFKSLKQKSRWWVGGLVLLLSAAIWYFWSDLVSLQNSILGPNFPVWGYAVAIGGIIAAIWILRMDKEKRERASTLAEWLIGFVAIGGALVVFNNWEKEDALCPDRQPSISVPATGMVVNVEACWADSQIMLDLRQTGPAKLSFNEQTAVLQNRTIEEFARIVPNAAGAPDGHGMLRFNAVEMRRLGITTLPVFVGPSEYQPGAQTRFTDADIEALTR